MSDKKWGFAENYAHRHLPFKWHRAGSWRSWLAFLGRDMKGSGEVSFESCITILSWSVLGCFKMFKASRFIMFIGIHGWGFDDFDGQLL